MEIFLVQILLGFIGLVFVFFSILEPIYVFFYNKPLLVHWHLFPTPIAEEQRSFLSLNFPFYARLSPSKKRVFEHRINKFIEKYEFIGHEINIIDEMRLLVAGTYVMLTFGMRHYLSDLIHKILVYPTVYYSTLNDLYHKGEFNPRMKTVVFSWTDFLSGHGVASDNINLGLHEFTHVLHFHCLKKNDVNSVIFQDEFEAILTIFKTPHLIQAINDKAYFRKYAYENQFEFISVLLEHFFETPKDFEKNHPTLYGHVKRMINYNEKYFIA